MPAELGGCISRWVLVNKKPPHIRAEARAASGLSHPPLPCTGRPAGSGCQGCGGFSGLSGFSGFCGFCGFCGFSV